MVSVRIKWFVFFLFAFLFFPIGLKAVEKPEQTTKAEPAKQTEKTEQVKKAEPAKQAEKPKASDTMTPPPMEPATESKSSTSTSSNERKDVETLEVTGSYIRRSDIEGPSPIVVFEKEELERSGFQTVSNFLLRHSTVGPFGGSLRGFGGGRQLVLINGQRAPASGSSYSQSGAVSTNLIPMAAVERIEILQDGASAIYGSDAMTGVINIITRKDLDGMAITSKVNVNEIQGRDNLRVSGAYGKTFSKGNFLTSLQYLHGTESRTSADRRTEFVSDQYDRSTNFFPENTGDIKPDPNCKRLIIPYGAKNELCVDNVTAERVSNPSHSLDWVTDARYKISSDMELYSTLYLGWGQSSSKSYSPTLGPRGFSFGSPPPGWGGLGIDNRPVTLWHRITELPGTETKDQDLSGGLIVGLNGYWGSSDWTWDISLNNQINHVTEEYNNMVLREPVYNAIKDGTYNPFGSPRNTDGFSYNVKDWNRYQVNWLEMKTTGNLGSLLGFDWSSVFGVSVANFAYRDESDDVSEAGEVIGLRSADSSGNRQLYAAFAEFAGIYDDLELQLALRGDHYSDFGSTFNPKVALKYQFIDWLAVRGSWGTGFRAPTLQQAYGPQLQGFLPIKDWVRCDPDDPNNQEGCDTKRYSATQGANPDLQEEISQNFNVGVLLEPIKDLSFSLDYWNVTVEDVIGYNPNALLQIAAIDPTALERYGVEIERRDPNDPKSEIKHVKALTQNIGTYKAHGIDFKGSYKIREPIFRGTFTLSTDFTYMFHYYTESYKELGRDDSLGRDPRWRNVAQLSYRLGPWSGNLTGRTYAKYEKDNRNLNTGFLRYIPSHTQYDLGINYQSPWGGVFDFGAINVFDGRPEYDDVTNRSRMNPSFYSALRTFFIGYRQDF